MKKFIANIREKFNSVAARTAVGTTGGIAGLIIGLVLAIVINMCRGKSTRNQSFPLVPYLAAGFLAAYFI